MIRNIVRRFNTEAAAKAQKALRNLPEPPPLIRMPPLNVALVGSALLHPIFAHTLGEGEILGKEQDINVRVVEEDADRAHQVSGPLVKDFRVVKSLEKGVEGANYVVAIQQSSDLVAEAKRFADLGKALSSVFDRENFTHVFTVGPHANTMALVLSRNAPNMPESAFMGVSYLQQLAAEQVLAQMAGLEDPYEITRLVLWGGSGKASFADISHARVGGKWVGSTMTSKSWVEDFAKKWDQTFSAEPESEGEKAVKAEGEKAGEAEGEMAGEAEGEMEMEAIEQEAAIDASAGLSAFHCGISTEIAGKKGIVGEEGTLAKEEYWVSYGVHSDGSYGIEKDLWYSVPTVCEGMSIKRVYGLPVTQYGASMMEKAQNELLKERDAVKAYL